MSNFDCGKWARNFNLIGMLNLGRHTWTTAKLIICYSFITKWNFRTDEGNDVVTPQ